MRICLIGPTYPFRGGIAHYTTLLSRHIQQETAHELLLISFSRQYPQLLYKGASDLDPSDTPLTTPAEYLIDSVSPLSWWRAANRIAQWDPDVIMLQWWTPYWTVVWALLSWLLHRRLPAAKQICICHNVMPHESHWYDGLALKLAISGVDSYIVHSEADGEQLAQLLPGRRWATAPIPTYAALGQNTAAFTPDLPEERPILLFCGLIREYKGLDILLEALPLVLQQLPVHLAIVGEFWGSSEGSYQEQLTRLDLKPYITVRNEYVPDAVLTAYVRRADVVVLPYRNATQSAVVQLAFGQLTPVITTDVGGLPEAVAHGKTGLIVPPADPAALANAILTFFEQGLAAQFQQEIANRQQEFSWQRLLETILLVAGQS